LDKRMEGGGEVKDEKGREKHKPNRHKTGGKAMFLLHPRTGSMSERGKRKRITPASWSITNTVL